MPECSAWNAGDGAGGVRCRRVRDGVPMTAHSPSSVAESASSTIDPDAQARRANEGEPSAGCQSDVTIDDDAVDGLLAAEEFAAEFDENLRRWHVVRQVSSAGRRTGRLAPAGHAGRARR